MTNNGSLSTIEQISKERIYWAHQRQLTMSALLLALGLGSFEILVNTLWIFWILYPAIVILFLIGIYSLFMFQREIFIQQYKLQQRRHEWNLDYKKSKLSWFFIFKNGIVTISKIKIILICSLSIVSFAIVLIDIKFFQTNSANMINALPDLTSITGILQFAIGLISGLIIFLIQDSIRRKRDKSTERNKMINSLIAELSENKNVSQESTYLSLSTDAWAHLRNSGILLDLQDELSKGLLKLYAKISNKNNLLIYYQIGIQTGKELGISDETGKIVTSLVDILAQLRMQIEKEINSVLPLLQKELDC